MLNDSVLAIFPGFALDILAKATLLLAAVSLLDLAMSRSAAAIRHRVWVTAFLGLLCLPLLSVVMPEYRLAVLPAHWIAGPPASSNLKTEKIPQEAILKSLPMPSLEPVQSASRPTSQDFPRSASAAAPPPFAQAETESPVVGLIAMVWCVGALVAIFPLLLGIFRIVVLQRCSLRISVREPMWNLAELCQKLGIRRRVKLLETNRAIVPMTWGLRRPVVLLPAAWRDWEPERCRLVLLHELAHVKRLDVVYQSMARVACSLLWFHPLVWYALSRLRVERELACDDCVLMAGERPSQYAQQLLSIALEYQSLALPSAVAIVQRSELEKRVRAMLDQARSHLPLEPKVAGAMLMFSIAFLVLIAPIRLGISQLPDPKNSPKNSTVLKEPQEPEIELDELVGIVVDSEGEPLKDVLVDAWSWSPGSETQTNSQGRFRLKKVGEASRKIEVRFSKEGYSPHYIAQQQLGVEHFSVTLGQKTYIEGTVRDPKGKAVPNAEIRGEQTNKQGDGVMIGSIATTTNADASGKFRLYVFPDEYQLLISVPKVGVKRLSGVIVAADEAKQVDIALEQGVRFEARVVDSDSGAPVKDVVLWNWKHVGVKGVSDAKGIVVIDEMLPGEFEFGLGEGEPVNMGSVRGYRPRTLGRWWSAEANHKYHQKLIEPNQFQRNFDDLAFTLAVGMAPVTIEVQKGVTFSGRVLDPNGKPVAGATVAPAKTGSGNSLTGDTRFSTKTDADGKYLVLMPAGEHFQYNLMAHDGDYQEWRTWSNGVGKPFVSLPGEVHEEMDLMLNRPATVRGKVETNGQPLKVGTKVSAQANDLLENRYYNPTALVAEDGSFELKFLRAGTHTIRVEKAKVVISIEAGETLEGVELQFQR